MSTKYYYHRYWGIFTRVDPRLYSPASNIIGVGYSGNYDMLNEPSEDHLVGQGCLPAGLYTITSTDSEKGPLTHHLTPDSTNNMKDRSGFLIHGDNPAANHTASDGCIAAPEWTRQIFKVGDQFLVL